MTREPGVSKCPACRRHPRIDLRGRMVCACEEKYWLIKAGLGGSTDERALLYRYGWASVELPNNIYWIGPAGEILLLHEGGKWYCDSAPERFTTLWDYLAWSARDVPAAMSQAVEAVEDGGEGLAGGEFVD